MRICIICGEEYDDSEVECPYCGYLIDNMLEKKPSFPEEFMKRYSFMKPGDNRGSEQTWIFWDNETQTIVIAGKLLKGEAGAKAAERLRTFKTHEDLDIFPPILEIHDSDEKTEGYYVYQQLEGQSMGEMIERRNPLSPTVVQSVEQSLKQICGRLEERGLRHGDLNLNNIWQSEGEIKLSDFGNGTGEETDISSVERIIFRLKEGFWPEDEAAINDETEINGRMIKILLGVAVIIIAVSIAVMILV